MSNSVSSANSPGQSPPQGLNLGALEPKGDQALKQATAYVKKSGVDLTHICDGSKGPCPDKAHSKKDAPAKKAEEARPQKLNLALLAPDSEQAQKEAKQKIKAAGHNHGEGCKDGCNDNSPTTNKKEVANSKTKPKTLALGMLEPKGAQAQKAAEASLAKAGVAPHKCGDGCGIHNPLKYFNAKSSSFTAKEPPTKQGPKNIQPMPTENAQVKPNTGQAQAKSKQTTPSPTQRSSTPPRANGGQNGNVRTQPPPANQARHAQTTSRQAQPSTQRTSGQSASTRPTANLASSSRPGTTTTSMANGRPSVNQNTGFRANLSGSQRAAPTMTTQTRNPGSAQVTNSNGQVGQKAAPGVVSSQPSGGVTTARTGQAMSATAPQGGQAQTTAAAPQGQAQAATTGSSHQPVQIGANGQPATVPNGAQAQRGISPQMNGNIQNGSRTNVMGINQKGIAQSNTTNRTAQNPNHSHHVAQNQTKISSQQKMSKINGQLTEIRQIMSHMGLISYRQQMMNTNPSLMSSLANAVASMMAGKMMLKGEVDKLIDKYKKLQELKKKFCLDLGIAFEEENIDNPWLFDDEEIEEYAA